MTDLKRAVGLFLLVIMLAFAMGCSSTGTLVKAGPTTAALGGSDRGGDTGHDARGDAGHGPGGYGH